MFNDVHNVSLNKLRKVSLNNMLFNRYDVICSSSMMGLNYKEIDSVSVGYKEEVTMYSLDFEEYLWALGYHEEQIEDLYKKMIRLEPLSNNKN